MLKSDFLGYVFAFVVDLAGVTQLTFVVVSETSFFTPFKQCINKFFIMRYSRKNPNRGIEDTEFPRVFKKEYVETLGVK